MVFLLETNMREKIYKVIAKSLNIDPSSLQEDLGPGDITEWDSLNHISLISALEQEFQVKLDVDEALDMETVGDIVEIFEEKIKIE